MGYIFLLIGVFGVPYAIFSLRKKKNDKKKNIFLAVLCTVVLFIGIYEIISSNQNNNTIEESTSGVSNNDQKLTEFSEADKKTALEIDSTITEHIKYLEPIELETNEIISNYADGKVDDYTAYEKIRKAKDQYSVASSSISEISIPKDLPDELKNDLEKIKSGVATNYYTRSKAMDYLLKYIDSQKVSDMDKMKQELEVSQEFVREIKLNLSLFYAKVGIPKDPQH